MAAGTSWRSSGDAVVEPWMTTSGPIPPGYADRPGSGVPHARGAAGGRCYTARPFK